VQITCASGDYAAGDQHPTVGEKRCGMLFAGRRHCAALPATGHFGTQAIHGVVREPKRSEQDDHRDDH